MAIFALNIKRSAVTGLALICLQNAPAHAESIAPNSDTRERWRVDYSDIGYPNVGFSPYIEGWINGYLTPADYPDGAAILPAPPIEGSAAWKADEENFYQLRKLRDTPRGRLAVEDANLSFNAIGRAFSAALGTEISRQRTPHTHLLLSRLLTDAGYASNGAKKAHARIRPYSALRVESCTPQEHSALSNDGGSYPSGHAVTGFVWAMTLTAMVPQRATELMRKGYEFGRSRLICGVHWASDVEAGRVLAAGAFARLQASAEYQQQFREAKREIDRLLQQQTEER
ncbi:TPA: phosphatase PAP2 family protein [Serratia marcescens]|uniref:acid phosphatase n=1 Tax=Serratia TaxID=613 RepID=UPI001A2F27DF|nr:phosphatase PAP2 family protein [Serratia marcescens]HAT4975592.1 phosphatase PAP2 family protein [Serratia marcescens]HAT4989928.1 phosphatase PAP2 family protein [Serratia marcescens]HAT5048431.1 phosphatase PAP2 family protein [Serratia marcescens]HEJ7078505.1 phosphatase PAP2 family protein [Serratia marcescens]